MYWLCGRLVTEYVAKEILDAWINTTKIDESEAKNIEILKKIDLEGAP